jgi:hypothetical protein
MEVHRRKEILLFFWFCSSHFLGGSLPRFQIEALGRLERLVLECHFYPWRIPLKSLASLEDP